MAIYTKRGDKGETSLYDKNSRQNIRVSKDSLRIEAIGAIDELNSYLGVASADLKDIQRDLFTIGSILAGAKLRFPKSKIKKLEKVIDKLEGTLPVLKNFILPGGIQTAANLQYARALCRRAERAIVRLEIKNQEILAYINRLSDYLFMLARKANYDVGIKEEVWKRK